MHASHFLVVWKHQHFLYCHCHSVIEIRVLIKELRGFQKIQQPNLNMHVWSPPSLVCLCVRLICVISDDRKLERDINLINKRSDERAHHQNMLKLNFHFHQMKRREAWNRDDKFSLDRLNFPQLRTGDRKLKSASLNQASVQASTIITTTTILLDLTATCSS